MDADFNLLPHISAVMYVEGLNPFTQYILKASVKPPSDGFWSNEAVTSFETEEAGMLHT